MARAEKQSLRFSRFESKRLLWALLLSILVHLGGWGGYEGGKKLGWWEHLHTLTSFGRKTNSKTVPPEAKKEQEEQPTVFVEVDQADPEPPKKAVYYSDKNTQAANPDADKNSNQPKLDGKQKDIPKTETVVKLANQAPEQPKNPSPESAPAKMEAASSLALGDKKLAQVNTKQPTENPSDNPTPEQKRPRTLKEARQQLHMPGEQMQQDGGVLRTRLEAAFDTKATPFGAYDAAMFGAIQQYWDDELEKNNYSGDRTGLVTIQFTLHYDGTVRDIKIVENGVGTLLSSYCQDAIDQTAPYAKWPSDMLNEIGSTDRSVRLTFHYYY